MQPEAAVLEPTTAIEEPYTPEPVPSGPDESLTEMIARRNAEARGEDASLTPPVETPAEPAAEAPETPVETPEAPVDELAQLRAQNAFYEEMFGSDLLQQAQVTTPEQPAQQAAAVEEDLLAPKEYVVTDDEYDRAYIEGDRDTLRALDNRRMDVIKHNLRLEQNQAIAQGIAWYLPVMLASQKFHERNPEFSSMPKADEIVGKLLPELRLKHPKASEVQLVRLAENTLTPLIKRAKTIMSQAAQGARKEVGASQQPSAQMPPARSVVNGNPPVKREPTAQERIEQLRRHAMGE